MTKLLSCYENHVQALYFCKSLPRKLLRDLTKLDEETAAGSQSRQCCTTTFRITDHHDTIVPCLSGWSRGLGHCPDTMEIALYPILKER